jgi:hypothetical protein
MVRATEPETRGRLHQLVRFIRIQFIQHTERIYLHGSDGHARPASVLPAKFLVPDKKTSARTSARMSAMLSSRRVVAAGDAPAARGLQDTCPYTHSHPSSSKR